MSYFEEELYKKGYHCIAGVDEAGRGPLAGPVVAAACILPKGFLLEGVDDSKKLDEAERETLYQKILSYKEISFSIGVVDSGVIDKINILKATFLAMQQAVATLTIKPDHILVDGNQIPPFQNISATGIVMGDSRSITIATASIIAKVTRDRMMIAFDAEYPGYGFPKHKGYATKEHRLAIQKLGFSPIHRKTFNFGSRA